MRRGSRKGGAAPPRVSDYRSHRREEVDPSGGGGTVPVQKLGLLVELGKSASFPRRLRSPISELRYAISLPAVAVDFLEYGECRLK